MSPPRRRKPDTRDRPARAAAPAPRNSRDHILGIATRLFAEQGFDAVSVRDIARECAVNSPTIYHFFGDKAGLYEACYRETFEAAARKLRSAIMDAPDAQARIRGFTMQLCRIFLEDHAFRRLVQREFLREEHRQITALTTHHFQEEFRLVAQAIAELHGEAQAMNRAFSIHALVLGLVLMRRIGELAGMPLSTTITPQRLANYVLGIVLPSSL